MMISWLSVDNIALTLLEYPMSWIELVGTVLYLWSVWLIAKRKMLTWPVGIVSVLLYLALFYQIGLYSDALEQVYYLGASIYGWVFWAKGNQKSLAERGATSDEAGGKGQASPMHERIAFGTRTEILTWSGVILVFSLFLG